MFVHARLIVVGGKANKKELALKLPVVVGRSRGAGLTIAHPMISRQHCEIYEAAGVLRIRDLGSTNGTYVGGKRVAEAVLRPHDRFSVGPLTFEVDYEYTGDATVAEDKELVVTAEPAGAEPEAPSPVAEEASPEHGPAEELRGPAQGPPAEEADEGFDFFVPAAEAAAEPEPAPEDAMAWGAAEIEDRPAPGAERLPAAGLPGPGELPVLGAEGLPGTVAPAAADELETAGPISPLPSIAPPDGQLPDFSAWSDAPGKSRIPPKSSIRISAPGAYVRPGASPPPQSAPPVQGVPGEPQAGPAWSPDVDFNGPAGAGESGALPDMAAWEEMSSEETPAVESPGAIESVPEKPKKRGWWPFGRRKARDKADRGEGKAGAAPGARASGPPAPEGPAWQEESTQNDLRGASPPSPPAKPAGAEQAPGETAQDAEPDLDEFFKSLE